MGFIAAVLLLHMGEEESFWTMVALMKVGAAATGAARAADTVLILLGEEELFWAMVAVMKVGAAAAATGAARAADFVLLYWGRKHRLGLRLR